MKSKKEMGPDYLTVVSADGHLFKRTHLPSNKTWVWTSRERPAKRIPRARNKVTIELLQEAGHKVRVKHFRLATYLGQNELVRKKEAHKFEFRVIVIPSSFRKDVMYRILPKGGYTHISIKNKDNKYICVSSECSEEDPFSYAAGVASALERLTRTELELLGINV